jgi:DNA-directed RNA polymerase subunit RPC12/RpoP
MTSMEHRYPCEACGADLRFAPGATGLVCDHCGHRQEVSPAGQERLAALVELDLSDAIGNRLPAEAMEDTRVLSCPNCGAQVEFDAAVHSKECPFCATPVVTDTGTHRHFKPQGLVPFALSEDQARAAMATWLRKLWFAPNALKAYARAGRRMQGIYTPFWTFDAMTRSRYRGQRGDHYYETRTRTVTENGKSVTKQEQVRKTRWTPVSGRTERHFDDVTVLASASLPREHVEGLSSWDLSALQPYRPDFLAGFRAEGYTVDLPEGHGRARDKMARIIEADVRRAIGGDEQRVDHVETDHSDETFKHILLPIWLAAYKFRGRTFRFVVNGQTGEVRGERPWSWIKITMAVLAAALVIAAVVLVGQQQ